MLTCSAPAGRRRRVQSARRSELRPVRAAPPARVAPPVRVAGTQAWPRRTMGARVRPTYASQRAKATGRQARRRAPPRSGPSGEARTPRPDLRPISTSSSSRSRAMTNGRSSKVPSMSSRASTARRAQGWAPRARGPGGRQAQRRSTARTPCSARPMRRGRAPRSGIGPITTARSPPCCAASSPQASRNPSVAFLMTSRDPNGDAHDGTRMATRRDAGGEAAGV